MVTTRTAVLLSAVVVTVGACVRIPDESVALARLAEAEILAVELVDEALGPGHVTSWEQGTSEEGCHLLCRGGPCHATGSRMFLEGVFEPNEVMEAFARAAATAGGRARDVEMERGIYVRRVFLTGPSGFRHSMSIFWEDGAVDVVVDTGSPGCYRVQE